jgi:hypothetical protein
MVRLAIKLGYWRIAMWVVCKTALMWLCSDTGLAVLALAVGALLWVNYWVIPHDQFLNAVASCMLEKGDLSSQEAYAECVDLVQTRK